MEIKAIELKTFIIRLSKKAGLLAAIVISWQYISTNILPATERLLFPPPTRVVYALLNLFVTGEIYSHILISFQRVLSGFGSAALIALPLGVFMGRWKLVEDVIDPLIELTRPIPPFAWIPLVILWFGIGEMQKDTIIFLGCFFPILIQTVHAVKSADKIALESVLTLGANKRQSFIDVIIPSALPHILTALRMSFGIGWMCLVGAELVAASSGLGWMIQDARNYLATDRVISGMLIIGMIGYLSNLVMLRIEVRVVPWYYATKIERG